MALNLYRAVVQPLLFSSLNLDPEQLHQGLMTGLDWLNRNPHHGMTRSLRAFLEKKWCLFDARLSQELWGVSFPNPVGLAAGFDKDGQAAGIWSSFGFGFAELGTVTQFPQPGNPKPRLFRLLTDEAVINRMGFNNQGSAALADRLVQVRSRYSDLVPLGINLGKSKITPLDDAAQDYLTSFQRLKTLGDYFVINVSSPNTPGLRSLQAVDQLKPIVMALQDENQGAKPLLIKISPDLDWEAIAAVVELTQNCELAGLIATNTTIQRQGLKTQRLQATGQSMTVEAGGLSGAPLRQRSTEVIRFIYGQTGGRLPIIGVGGIFTADDAWEKITAGASLVQIYTGWIYEGPGMVRRILEGLQQKLIEHQLSHLTEAIGQSAQIEHR